ncbi:MAG: hypothetical protein ACRDNB_08055 [Gaiellaceae bacterium]
MLQETPSPGGGGGGGDGGGGGGGGGGGEPPPAQALVDLLTADRVDLFPAASYASTANVYVVPQASAAKVVLVAVVLPRELPLRYSE